MPVLDRFRLDGRVAVVTGASSGLGVSIALALAEAGADVAIGALDADGLERTAALVSDAGRRCAIRVTDIKDPEACRELVAAAVSELGGLDILVNNAGIGTAQPALRESEEAFRHVLDVNLNGSFWMAQAAAQAMRKGGSIVNVSSVAAQMSFGMPQASYAASKAGLDGLTRDLAQQWTGRLGVRVNGVAPGIIGSTGMTSHFFDELLEAQRSRIPVGRAGDPAEVAAAIVFLASDAASYVTGETLVVDGGRTIL